MRIDLFRQPGRRRPVNRRRKPSRRRKSQHILDVRIRSTKVREQRQRWAIGVVCRLVILLALIGGLFFGGVALLDALFFANEEYTLRSLDVEGCRTLDADEVVAIAEVSVGQNIFRVNLGKARGRIEAEPRIQSASLERILPDRLVIRVTEREPIAWVVPASAEDDPFGVGKSYLVDSHGVLMRTERMHPEFAHLPLITGMDVEALAAGGALDSTGLRAALDLILLNENRLSPIPFIIREIDLSAPYCVEVTDAEHAKVKFDFDNLDEQLRKLDLLVEHARAIGRRIESVNLVPERNIPVRFLPVLNDGGEEIVAGDGALPVMRALPAGE